MLVIMLITSKGWIEHMGRQNGMQEVYSVAKTPVVAMNDIEK